MSQLIEEPRLFENHCSIFYLRVGFELVRRNHGAPGIDGLSIMDFEANLDEVLSQFFDRLEQMHGVSTARFPEAARDLGLAMIFCGVMAAVISLYEYRWMIHYLWSETFVSIAGLRNEKMRTPLYATTIVLILIGIFAFFALLFCLV